MSTVSLQLPIEPADIDLSVPGALPPGAAFAFLPTFEELEQFWVKHPPGIRFTARAEGLIAGPTFLGPDEWVFAEDEVSLITAVTRWEVMGIRCEWYDWENDAAASYSHAQWLHDWNDDRRHKLADGAWTPEDEKRHHVANLVVGEWIVTNLPGNMTLEDWFPALDTEQLTTH